MASRWHLLKLIFRLFLFRDYALISQTVIKYICDVIHFNDFKDLKYLKMLFKTFRIRMRACARVRTAEVFLPISLFLYIFFKNDVIKSI